jgi:predicted O-methyltransferase YrrM
MVAGRWRYVRELFAPEDTALCRVRDRHRDGELPEIHISPDEGAVLRMLLHAVGATRVLEVGTLGGYSAIWMARAVGPGGRVTTIEGSPKHAAFARAAFDDAGVADRIALIEGEALDTLETLTGPFDAVFLDADKAPLPQYFGQAMRLLRRGGLLACDNTYMDGQIVDAASGNPDVAGMRTFNRLVADDPRLVAAVIPVRDGLLAAVRVAD